MGEAIITRAGAVYDENTPKMSWKLYTEVITANTTYTVPTCKNQELTVMCFGGGGGCGSGNYNGGGGGGYMNKSVVAVAAGQSVAITIGAGGSQGSSGGTTSFGGLLSAIGGAAPANAYSGGNGGAGGGTCIQKNRAYAIGGRGYNFGGGGVAICGEYHQTNAGMPNITLGAGGPYGGEGGGVFGFSRTYYNQTTGVLLISKYTSTHNTSTSAGGTGGSVNTSNIQARSFTLPTNGTALSANNIINGDSFTVVTTGKCGTTKYGNNTSVNAYIAAFGGGGGLGGCGGNGAVGGNANTQGYGVGMGMAGGGGGGYGANGGNGAVSSFKYGSFVYNFGFGGAGGGGGYRSPGTDGTAINNNYWFGGGGGGYGKGNYGRGSNYNLAATSGCVVIQYYGVVYE